MFSLLNLQSSLAGGSGHGSLVSGDALLTVEDLTVRYGAAVTALHNVSVTAGAGEITAILGGNGAGKTTLMRTISGVLFRHAGQVLSGEVRHGSQSLLPMPPERRVASGIVLVPEGRRIFGRLTVRDNLRVGRFGHPRGRAPGDLERIFDLFPDLADKRHRLGAYLSGGEQQMLAIGRALMASPGLLLLDEPTLGLAPLIIDRIVELLDRIRRDGTTLLLVEQNASVALDLADQAHVFANGRVALSGPAATLRRDDRVRKLYLGDASEFDTEDEPS